MSVERVNPSELEEAFRLESGRAIASLIRLTGDVHLADEALQDALVTAAETWEQGAIPLDPGAWLRTVARNKALDRIRRERKREDIERAAAFAHRLMTEGEDEEDLLRLIFTCCHPSLSPTSQAALCLRIVCGLRTPEIARLLLCSESAVSQRILRAKEKIALAHIPYSIPGEEALPDRLEPVLSVIYLLFTTGHHAPFGELTSRHGLALEAIELTRRLARLMPRQPELLGLLALELSTEARAPGRLDASGDVVLLPDQDRRSWNADLVLEASSLWQRALALGDKGPYVLQAGISCLHSLAPSFEATDWSSIVQLYRQLDASSGSPVVRVNRAIAESWLFGPQAGLDLLDATELRSVVNWAPRWIAAADFQRRLGVRHEAEENYARAASCAANETERRMIDRMRRELDGTTTPRR